jgi:hypothetical protein
LSAAAEAIEIRWRPRALPLRPLGALALGDRSRALASRLLADGDERLERLRGAAGVGVLLVLGSEADLPWIDGIRYLGRDDRAPLLLLPCEQEPDAPLAIVQAALLRRLGTTRPPVALTPAPARLVSASAASPIDRASLSAWLAAEAR